MRWSHHLQESVGRDRHACVDANMITHPLSPLLIINALQKRMIIPLKLADFALLTRTTQLGQANSRF